MIDGLMTFLYIFMLSAFTGYEVINRVPVILHTPLMSGTNFIHGIILIGAMIALGQASSVIEQAIGFFCGFNCHDQCCGGLCCDRAHVRNV